MNAARAAQGAPAASVAGACPGAQAEGAAGTAGLGEVFAAGLLRENPVLRQALGLCSTLAITTAVTNGIGMGLATTFVLVCSGMVVSAVRRLIPDSVRIPAYITIIASFVTLVMMVVKAYLPALDSALGIYLSLIVVNCIVLGRAEAFASKHGVLESAADGLGMGIGFTITLVLMSAVREVLGAGTFLGVRVLPGFVEPMLVMVTPAGGFATLGVILAASVAIERRRRPEAEVDLADDVCATCTLGCAFKANEDRFARMEQAVERFERDRAQAGVAAGAGSGSGPDAGALAGGKGSEA